MRIEARPSLNELSDHGIHFAEVVLGTPKPRRSPVGIRLNALTDWHLLTLPSR